MALLPVDMRLLAAGAETSMARPSQPARVKCRTTCDMMRGVDGRCGAAGNQQSINCNGARQVLVVKRIPMRNSKKGLNTGRIASGAASAGMCRARKFHESDQTPATC